MDLFDDRTGDPVPIEVELDAYILPSDHGVWKVFPGRTYRFLEAVRASHHVFMDVRGLRELPGTPFEWDQRAVISAIANDRWTRELARTETGAQPKGGAGITKQDRKVFGFLKGLLLEAKKGDLVVLPADGYRREVLIGELLDEPGVVSFVEAKDGGEVSEYVGRRVKWLPSKEKREFHERVIKSLHSSAAFHTIAKSARQEIYEVAYQNFILEDLFVATFQTTKQQFTTSDNAIVSVWFNALAATFSAQEGDPGSSIADKSFAELGLLQSAESQRGELSIYIASPGSVLLHSAGVFALATMALFPLMELDAATLAASPIAVKLHTVGGAGKECELVVSKAAEGIIQTLSVKRLQAACETAMRARDEATLGTRARLKKPPKKPK